MVFCLSLNGLREKLVAKVRCCYNKGPKLIGKDPDAGQDWRWEEKWATEDAMVGWHHRLDIHESEQALRVGDGQGSLASYSPWCRKELDTTEWLNWTEWQWNVKNPSFFLPSSSPPVLPPSFPLASFLYLPPSLFFSSLLSSFLSSLLPSSFYLVPFSFLFPALLPFLFLTSFLPCFSARHLAKFWEYN